MRVTTQVSGEWLIARLERAPAAYLAVVAEQMDQVSRYLYDRVYQNLSGDRLQSRTGHLREGLRRDVAVYGTKVTARVWIEGVLYARIQERGGLTRPHMIVPRMAQALRFEVGGAAIFTMHARHPGSRIPASMYMRDVLLSDRTRITQQIRDAVKRAKVI